MRLHERRHTYANVVIQAKVNVLVLGRLLGHAQSETMLKYIYLNSADACQAAADVSALVELSAITN
ncbi:hypothetical protein L1D24_05940 [Vibrio brasiliensis]|uniref:hypothetical protein n=1 Tax=Vibrio brasiliensis TaxID=170652 RepID=UPI001EFC8671|nr:hypothetical protein [Vibrio brasiliensis]MCG9648110.1 hypothetical protein [Vibrio brasiliensis]